MTIAIVNFRTITNGAYKYIRRGQRRGFWRVLLMHDINGSTTKTSNNVQEVIFEGREGIDGVTKRSSYCLDSSLAYCQQLAAQSNIETIALALVRHHTPEGLPL